MTGRPLKWPRGPHVRCHDARLQVLRAVAVVAAVVIAGVVIPMPAVALCGSPGRRRHGRRRWVAGWSPSCPALRSSSTSVHCCTTTTCSKRRGSTQQRPSPARSRDVSSSRLTLAADQASCHLYKLCVLMHQVHIGSSPSYLSDLVTATANIQLRK